GDLKPDPEWIWPNTARGDEALDQRIGALEDIDRNAAAIIDAGDLQLLGLGQSAPPYGGDHILALRAALDAQIFAGDQRQLAGFGRRPEAGEEIGRQAMAMDVPDRPHMGQEPPARGHRPALPDLLGEGPQPIHGIAPVSARRDGIANE